MYHFEKISLPEEGTLLRTVSDTDFEYSFRLYEKCSVKTDLGNCITGELSYIGDDFLKIQTAEIGEIAILFSVIKDIDEIIE